MEKQQELEQLNQKIAEARARLKAIVDKVETAELLELEFRRINQRIQILEKKRSSLLKIEIVCLAMLIGALISFVYAVYCGG